VNVPILVYHHVYGDDDPELAHTTGAGVVTATALRRQVMHLLDEGWRVVATGDLVDGLVAGTALPQRSACLHFDNGWLDTATVAAPILRECGVAAMCYPISDSITAASEGRSVEVRTATEGDIEKPFMTWEMLQGLVDAGWEIGAHTATHRRLGDTFEAQGEAAIAWEAESSNRAFESHLGVVPRHFAYPSGSRNGQTDAILSHYYDSLRLWDAGWPDPTPFTHEATSPMALVCQNIDTKVEFGDFQRMLQQAVKPRNREQEG
jgi:peptidoglycan/xylan/chitin deacetylase (PgdA/CDA1 family)